MSAPLNKRGVSPPVMIMYAKMDRKVEMKKCMQVLIAELAWDCLDWFVP